MTPTPTRPAEHVEALVHVDLAEDGYIAVCREHGTLAVADNPEVAAAMAARHLARVHG